MTAQTVNSTKLATMDANLEPGLVANSEALQPSLDDIVNVVNTNANVFNTHETAAVLAHPDGSVTNAKVAAGIDAAKIGAGTVSNTEFGYLDGVTSSLQPQINGKQPSDATLTALAAFNTNGIMKQTAPDTFTAVVAPTGAIVGTTDTQTLTNKSIDAAQLTGTVPIGRLPTSIDAANIADGSVSNTEFQYINSLTSNAQTQLDAKAPLSHVGSGGNAHSEVSTVQSGFMSTAMYDKLNGLSPNGLSGYDVPADQALSFGGRFKIVYISATDTLDIYEI